MSDVINVMPFSKPLLGRHTPTRILDSLRAVSWLRLHSIGCRLALAHDEFMDARLSWLVGYEVT